MAQKKKVPARKTAKKAGVRRPAPKGGKKAAPRGPVAAGATKLIYLLWAPSTWEPRQVKGAILDVLVPHLGGAGVTAITLYCKDGETTVKSPAPNLYGKTAPDAKLCLWVKSKAAHGRIEKAVAETGFTSAAYRVTESVYKDYGDNAHAAARHWPDGVRSPGVVAVTLMERPAKLPRAEWIRRWHGAMSPLSESIQPRTRYVRNVVEEALTRGAPPFEGIVAEAWPSPRHVSNPFLFYGARNPLMLPVNMVRILRAVTSFLSLRKIQTVMMGEYILKSAWKK
ncbi:MAG: hypothetical protein J0L75_06255 [Spirochaetes bacterium]|nr:hypothetical protein [Spirochaetota bacterium]